MNLPLTQIKESRFRILLFTQGLWLFLVLALGVWWSRLVFTQAQKISELELRLGTSIAEAATSWEKIRRMLFWEGLSFLSLVIASSLLLFFLYWRYFKRMRGMQAFFAGVTHELRTPLTGVRLQSEAIAESVKRWMKKDRSENSDPEVLRWLTLTDRLVESSVQQIGRAHV